MDAKTRELIVLLAARSQGNRHWGMKKLFKLLWFCDVEAYRRDGAQITQFRYLRLPFGPVPEPAYAFIDQMVEVGDLRKEERRLGEHVQVAVVSLRPIRRGVLSQGQVDAVERVLAAFGHLTAKELEGLTHQGAWRASRPGGEVRVEAEALDLRPLTDVELVAARAMAASVEPTV